MVIQTFYIGKKRFPPLTELRVLTYNIQLLITQKLSAPGGQCIASVYHRVHKHVTSSSTVIPLDASNHVFLAVSVLQELSGMATVVFKLVSVCPRGNTKCW